VSRYTTTRCVCINGSVRNSFVCVRTVQLIHARLIYTCDLKTMLVWVENSTSRITGFTDGPISKRNKYKYRTERPTLVSSIRTSETSNGATAVSTDYASTYIKTVITRERFSKTQLSLLALLASQCYV
jgi:hypothetical protein